MSEKIASKQKVENTFPCVNHPESIKWDKLDSIILALTLIWAGILFIGNIYGYFSLDPWSAFFKGAGFLVIAEIIIRLLYPAYKDSFIGHIMWAGFLFWLSGIEIIFPVMIVIAGIYIIYKVFAEKYFNISK